MNYPDEKVALVAGDDLNSGLMKGKLRRRDFLGTGALAGAGLLCSDMAYGAKPANEASCILLMLVGGPSQIDTWDMKPEAPAEIRGPFRPIRTNAPGVRISEIFPRMARHADKYAILRAVHHDATHTRCWAGFRGCGYRP